MFEYTTDVRLQDTDAAGVVYFSRQFAYAHAAYEAFLDDRSLPLARLLSQSDVHLPIVRAEADYRDALRLGDHLTVQVVTGRTGDSSFALNYRILKGGEEEIASSITTVHVAISSGTREKVDLPEDIRAALASL